jgi:hypothetical protein
MFNRCGSVRFQVEVSPDEQPGPLSWRQKIDSTAKISKTPKNLHHSQDLIHRGFRDWIASGVFWHRPVKQFSDVGSTEISMQRRVFIKSAPALALMARPGVARVDIPDHRWDGYDFGPGPKVMNRLNQGPFGIEQDEGWFTIDSTSPSKQFIPNFGLGLVGYTWEENGPSLAARAGRETLEQHVDKLSSLPFVDVLYIRCDWRDVQSKPGRLDLSPIWKLTFDAARQRNLRVGFRVQLSSPNIQPKKLSLPDFVREKVPLVNIGHRSAARQADFDFFEPRYDHPEFQKAFRELNELLVAEFDGNPLMEFVDIMMYGFWGEGHTSDLPNPFPRLPHGREDLRPHDATAARCVEEGAAGRQYAAGHQ